MKGRLRASVLATGLLLAMLPAATAAARSFDYWVDAGCFDTAGQFMDLSGAFASRGAWKQFARDVEAAAMPDTGETDGICSPGSILVSSVEKRSLSLHLTARPFDSD